MAPEVKLLNLNPIEKQRMRAVICGVVQGVGFRPFVFKLATQLGLTGWVNNTSAGLILEVEGRQGQLENFLKRLKEERPVHSMIQSLEFSFFKPVGFEQFEIRYSETLGDKTALVLPDIATCAECLEEIFNPHNRRYLYPFTNCTHCGPRFSIIEALPYDRVNTSMKSFAMCPECRTEYTDPLNRRFHAQPNACPNCGPHLEFWNQDGIKISSHSRALLDAVDAIQSGGIIALKGLGGFQLLCNAQDSQAVTRLRLRKHREEKPFALMLPSLASVKLVCEVSPLEEELLFSSESPIVLLKRRQSFHSPFFIAPNVAPGNPHLGVMLPYTPLHHILMRELNFPVVATSGNLSDEPIAIDEHEALGRLAGIADCFLVHNRPIVRHVDDSVVRVMADRPIVLRRARGYAPLPIHFSKQLPRILAVGGHQKNSVAMSVDNNIFLSQHIGDLESQASLAAFRETIHSFEKLYESTPQAVAADGHPEYFSTTFAKSTQLPLFQVQHHHAHIVSCMAENDIDGEVLGISWDGTGFGSDGTIWGGEFLLSTLSSFERVGFLKPFPLAGSEKAVKEPRRVALALLYETLGDVAFELRDLECVSSFSQEELSVMAKMIKNRIHSPLCSSVGRLFDGVASLVGLYQTVSFEGQAAMGLEFLLEGVEIDGSYQFKVSEVQPFIFDWTPTIKGILEDLKDEIPQKIIAAKFHNTLIEMIMRATHLMKKRHVVLSGGCFQNKYLTEKLISRIQKEGFQPFWHQRVPPNDGGISLGQIVSASFRMRK